MAWVTVRQLAAHLQISEATVYAMARSGDLPGTKVGNQWRFDPVEVDEALRKQSGQSAPGGGGRSS